MKHLLLVVLVGILMHSCQQEKPLTEHNQKEEEKPLIQPPITGVDVAFDTITFLAEKGVEYTGKLGNGTSLSIPAKAFVDGNGDTITGNVSLVFREFHDAADIYLSGIPMQYNAAGKTEHFETAGMFEIRLLGKNEVRFAENKRATIDLASNAAGVDYKFFKLDEEKMRDWHYLGETEPRVNESRLLLEKKIKDEKPEIPHPFTNAYLAFNYSGIVDVMYNNDYRKIGNSRESAVRKKMESYGLKCMEIINYQRVKFHGNSYMAYELVWKNNGKEIPRWASESSSELSQIGSNKYKLVLKKGTRKFKTEIEIVMKLKHLFAKSPEKWNTEYEDLMKKVLEDEQRVQNMAKVFRTFEVNEFGVYNWDRFIKQDQATKIAADFIFPSEIDKMNEMEVVYVSPTKRSLIKCPKSEWEKFVYLPEEGGMLFTVLPGNEVAVFSKERYNALPKEKIQQEKQYTFDLISSGVRVNEGKDLKMVLGLVN